MADAWLGLHYLGYLDVPGTDSASTLRAVSRHLDRFGAERRRLRPTS